jgi:hypothetical protein
MLSDSTPTTVLPLLVAPPNALTNIFTHPKSADGLVGAAVRSLLEQTDS